MSDINIGDIVSNPMKNFASDNASGVHPDVMAAMAAVNQGHVVGYGGDAYSAQMDRLFKDTFGEQATVFPLFNGTGSNVLALKGMMWSQETVYCSEEAHLLVDECGAPENHIGCKLVTMPSRGGKVDVDDIRAQVKLNRGFVHRSQPRVISIAQATERGTVYSLAELKAIVAFARENGLLVHMDGARIHNAAAALGVTFREMTTDIGIDVVSFGGTKNGLMMAEAIVVLNPSLHRAYPYVRKQGMQLASKHRFLAAQYLAYLQNDLWLKNALAANEAAAYLAAKLTEIDGISLSSPVDINVVFARVPKDWIPAMQEACFFNVWDGEKGEVRLITSYDTTTQDIDQFIEAVVQIASSERK